jgi:lipopolysaccharide transport system ATP-binding protein
MQDISKGEGRTVLFVSHNMAAVKILCTSVLVLDKGLIEYDGSTDKALVFYKNLSVVKEDFKKNKDFKNENIELLSVKIKPNKGEIICIDSGIDLEISFKNELENINLDCTLEIVNEEEIIVYHKGALAFDNYESKKGIYNLNATIPPNLFNAGLYRVNLVFGKDKQHLLLGARDVLSFEIDSIGAQSTTKRAGIVYMDFDWKVNYTRC